MAKYKLIVITAVIFPLLAILSVPSAFSQNHIKDLDNVRTSMTELGGAMPELIKSSKIKDLRTLERVYEINTYALTTIEAYLKMIKIAISSNGSINKDIVNVFNGWLEFINTYCGKDVQYLNEALAETQDQSVIDIIQKTKFNIESLRGVTTKAIDENKNLLK